MAVLLLVAFKLDHTGKVGQAGVAAALPMNVKLVVKTDEEHAKMGPEGTWHDAFLPADFSVKAGQIVNVAVYNYDESPHTFTAPALGVNEEIAGGSESKPAETTFSFVAPLKAGRYTWRCAMPCDPWSMSHLGYMRGRVTVT